MITPRLNSQLIGGYTLVEALAVVFLIGMLAMTAVHYRRSQERLRGLQITSRARADMHALVAGINSYHVDHGRYPAMANGAAGANNLPGATSETLALWTFRVKSGPNDPLMTLTTPVNYCNSYYRDPFATPKGTTFGYYCVTHETTDESLGESWIMWSAGPDRDYDIDPATDFEPRAHPSIALIHKTYDPTNGTRSNGDVWMTQ